MISSLALSLAVAAQAPPQGPDWTVAVPDYSWEFPRDHWAHDGYKTEWWYITGHLAPAGDSVPRFGYQFTFFKVGLFNDEAPGDSDWSASGMIMGHAALTDITTGTHAFSEILYRAAPALAGFGDYPDPVIARSAAPAGTPGEWTISWNGSGFDFEMEDRTAGFGFTLTTEPLRRMVMQGPNGYSSKGGDSSASQYYSLTRLATAGMVRTGGDTLTVNGTSWMDKEFGSNQLAESQSGWDWFSIQLDDGRDLMLYRIRGSPEHHQATLTSADGTTRFLDPRQWNATGLRTWTSELTGATYPVAWSISIPEERLEFSIRPVIDNQENVSRLLPELYYWEGAMEVVDPDGRVVGRGYTELTGYGNGSRPAL